MKKPKPRNHVLVLLFLATLSVTLLIDQSCSTRSEEREAGGMAIQTAGGEANVLVTTDLNLDFSKHKVTFIELGADRCIPCKAMQPIMKDIAKEFVGKIQVVFYDVWKDATPARKYGIQLIPTQVFIDRTGKEISRHVGFFPKEEILSMLREKGIL